jgi:hypothetical protein
VTEYTVCLIGNSHLGAIRQAWARRARTVAAGMSAAFFSAPTSLLEAIDLRDGCLIARSRELKDKFIESGEAPLIEIGRYDAFVLVGLRFGLDILKICEPNATARHLTWGAAERVLSQACFDAVVDASFDVTGAIRLADMIRAQSAKPILICPVPFRMAHTLELPEYAGQTRLREPELLWPVVARGKRAAEAIAAAHVCEIVWQDDCTTGPPGYTRFEFSRSSAAAGREDVEQDRWHGNVAYGQLMLTAVLARLDELSGGRVLAGTETATSGV